MNRKDADRRWRQPATAQMEFAGFQQRQNYTATIQRHRTAEFKQSLEWRRGCVRAGDLVPQILAALAGQMRRGTPR